MTESELHAAGTRRFARWRGTLAASFAGVVQLAFRGCWHAQMSWPLFTKGYSYRVCLTCGAIRLFDEQTLSPYGPVRYNLDALIAWERTRRRRRPNA